MPFHCPSELSVKEWFLLVPLKDPNVVLSSPRCVMLLRMDRGKNKGESVVSLGTEWPLLEDPVALEAWPQDTREPWSSVPALDLLESSLQPEFNLETEKDELMDRPSSNMGMRFAAYLPSPGFGLMSALLYREGRAAGSRGAWGGIPSLIKSGDLCLHREKENESTGSEPMRPNTMSQDGRAQREKQGQGWQPSRSSWVLRAGWRCLALEVARLALGCSRWLFLQTS